MKHEQFMYEIILHFTKRLLYFIPFIYTLLFQFIIPGLSNKHSNKPALNLIHVQVFSSLL